MQHRMFALIIIITTAAAIVGAGTPAAADPKPDDAVEYRQGMMMGIGWNVSPMGAMVKGKIPFDRDQFAFFAGRAALLAPMALEGFTPNTADTKSEAKPKLWLHLDDFKKRIKDLEEATAKLASVAKGGDEAAMKQQFGDTFKVCKGCHDEYQKKH